MSRLFTIFMMMLMISPVVPSQRPIFRRQCDNGGETWKAGTRLQNGGVIIAITIIVVIVIMMLMMMITVHCKLGSL